MCYRSVCDKSVSILLKEALWISCEDPKATFVQFFSKNALPEFRQELDGQDYDIDGYNIGKSKESLDKVMP